MQKYDAFTYGKEIYDPMSVAGEIHSQLAQFTSDMARIRFIKHSIMNT